MKKITILLLSVLTTVILGGCENNPPVLTISDLDKHVNTINDLDTYVIKFESSKSDNGVVNNNTNYIYVDNVNESFVISVYDKENSSILNYNDLVFQFENDSLYNYMYDDVWIKHQINKEMMNVIDFEEAVFDYLCSIKKEETNTEVIYTSSLSLEDIKDSGYTAFGGGIPDKYYSIQVPLTIVFNKDEERFTSFEFDFKPVLEAMDVDLDLVTGEDDYWTVRFEYTKLNEEFSIVVDEYVVDDFIDDFNQDAFNEIKDLYSYELINGCVNYSEDKDLIRIKFETSGLYQLSLRTLSGVDDLVVTIMDSSHNILRTFNLNNEDDHTSYWNYAKGTYYVLVSGNLLEQASADYSFIFMSN